MTQQSGTSAKVSSIGNYRFTGRRLGKGNFAKVEEAIHVHLNLKVAVKVMDITQIKEDYVVKNLYREAKILSRLSHPCIVALFQTMQHGSVYYLVTELIGGGDLCSFIKSQKNGRLEEKFAKVYARQLVSALSHMHNLGIVHRDLKLENIMLNTVQTQIKIVDFGLSNIYNEENPLRTHCGSPEYAAPELFVEGKHYGPEVDIWSLGVIFYGMIVGQLPFVTARDEHTTSQERRKKLLEQINRGLASQQKRALANYSQEFRSSLMPRLLIPESSRRISINELLFHPWVTDKGRKAIRTNPIRKADEKLRCLAYKHIAAILEVDAGDVQKAIKADRQGNIAGMYNIIIYRKQLQLIEGDSVSKNLYIKAPKSSSTTLYTTPRPKSSKPFSGGDNHMQMAEATKMFESAIKTMQKHQKELMKSAPMNKVSSRMSATPRTSQPSSSKMKTPLSAGGRPQSALDNAIKISKRKQLAKRSITGDSSTEHSITRSPHSNHNSNQSQSSGMKSAPAGLNKKLSARKAVPVSARSNCRADKSEMSGAEFLAKGESKNVCDKFKRLCLGTKSSKELEQKNQIYSQHMEINRRPSTTSSKNLGPPNHTAERALRRYSLMPAVSSSRNNSNQTQGPKSAMRVTSATIKEPAVPQRRLTIKAPPRSAPLTKESYCRKDIRRIIGDKEISYQIAGKRSSMGILSSNSTDTKHHKRSEGVIQHDSSMTNSSKSSNKTVLNGIQFNNQPIARSIVGFVANNMPHGLKAANIFKLSKHK